MYFPAFLITVFSRQEMPFRLHLLCESKEGNACQLHQLNVSLSMRRKLESFLTKTVTSEIQDWVREVRQDFSSHMNRLNDMLPDPDFYTIILKKIPWHRHLNCMLVINTIPFLENSMRWNWLLHLTVASRSIWETRSHWICISLEK